jgi:hypothetical protein
MLLGVARSYCPSARYMMPRWNLGKGRDLDPDKVTFLYFPSREIPLKYPLVIKHGKRRFPHLA